MVINVWCRYSAASVGLVGRDSSCSQFSLVKLTKLPESLNMYIRVRAKMRMGTKRGRFRVERSVKFPRINCAAEDFEDFSSLGSPMEIWASNNTEGVRDEYSWTTSW